MDFSGSTDIHGKPLRCTLYGDNFYCPLINGSESWYVPVTAFPGSLPNEKDPQPQETPMEEEENEAEKNPEAPEVHSGTHNSQTENGDGDTHHVDPESVVEHRDEEVVASEKVSRLTLEHFIADPVEIPSAIRVDTGINTSQPILQDIATGNSQPIMMDCASGMSQPLMDTMDCATQTSQGLFDDNDENRFASAKAPIVLKRGSGQTSAPNVPAKIPRLDELDRYGRSTTKPLDSIYSSDVTFEFDDSDKENDKTILKQRGNVGRSLRDIEDSVPREDSSNRAGGNNKGEGLPTSSSSNILSLLPPRRGTFLRVGLSKKNRSRKPLHPVFRYESDENENMED